MPPHRSNGGKPRLRVYARSSERRETEFAFSDGFTVTCLRCHHSGPAEIVTTGKHKISRCRYCRTLCNQVIPKKRKPRRGQRRSFQTHVDEISDMLRRRDCARGELRDMLRINIAVLDDVTSYMRAVGMIESKLAPRRYHWIGER